MCANSKGSGETVDTRKLLERNEVLIENIGSCTGMYAPFLFDCIEVLWCLINLKSKTDCLNVTECVVSIFII